MRAAVAGVGELAQVRAGGRGVAVKPDRARVGAPLVVPRAGPGRAGGYPNKRGPGIGAEIMGRNMFGPHRGPWQDQERKGCVNYSA
jgi:hypothetical protein